MTTSFSRFQTAPLTTNHENTMQTKNDTSKPENEPQQETGEGCSGASCSALWEVQVKGQKCSSSWEISVIRKDNIHGHRSWGWFDATKLLVSHNGGPCSWPIVEFVWDEQIRIAHELCSKLNSGEISLENAESIRAGIKS